MGPCVEAALVLALVHASPTARQTLAVRATRLEIDPHLVGVRRTLREVMAHVERADHDFNEIGFAGPERGQIRTQRLIAEQRRLDGATLLDAEEIDAQCRGLAVRPIDEELA